MSTHPPGPWTYEIAHNGYHVKNVDGHVVAVVRTAEAAKQLVAWPTMLAALEMVRDANRSDPHIPAIALATIDAAIAKARGQS
jgi:hypothetical protein